VTAAELFRAGRLDEAIASLGDDLRREPADAQRRTFLFELLCFAGEHDRAQKQLGVLAGGTKEAHWGSLLYHGALHADRLRQAMFRDRTYPPGPAPTPPSGTLNGRPFQSLVDADPRIGPRLEVYAAGQYLWIPFAQLSSVRMTPPKRLRDLLWAPAVLRASPEFQDFELGEVLLPVLAPLSWQHTDDGVRLGRLTEWVALEDGAEIPLGQKLLLVDGEEIPILELRELDIASVAAARA